MTTTDTASRQHVTGASRPQEPSRKPFSWGRAAAPGPAMIIIILITLFPFYWMLRTALSTTKSLLTDPASLLPVDFTLGRVRAGPRAAPPRRRPAPRAAPARRSNFWLYLRNSVIFATLITVGQVFFSALAAYAFARLRWPGRDKVFVLFLTALMVPPIFTRCRTSS